jgi:hypothetical protein
MLNSDETTPAGQQPKQAHPDQEYTFGRPLETYLSAMQITRLTILRSKLRDLHGDLTPSADRVL